MTTDQIIAHFVREGYQITKCYRTDKITVIPPIGKNTYHKSYWDAYKYYYAQ